MKLCRNAERLYIELFERQRKTETGATDKVRTVPPRTWANDHDPSKSLAPTFCN
ncbi:hypothetical protein DPMN_062681 [Dreissena polymorpha]|uniref:Uncharacterized protein n=1 Tax=Dreissena polymorpha TaxID=45954 RepID=A0A9D4CA18_DREPO|nr:hypothetical protein DPMN_062681 [Dreissena polymorpha]